MKPYNILQKLDKMVKVLPKPNKKKRPTKNLIPFSLYSGRTLTYRKLPEQQSLKLSVLKLDGSSFSVHVARNATVAALKFAVQEEFCLSPRDERARLWALVWSHFCLCYQGQKLIRDVDSIQKYGIKDGDQLCFVHHLRVDLAPALEQSKDPGIKPKQASNAEQRYSGELALLWQPKSRLTGSLKELLSCSKF